MGALALPALQVSVSIAVGGASKSQLATLIHRAVAFAGDE